MCLFVFVCLFVIYCVMVYGLNVLLCFACLCLCVLVYVFMCGCCLWFIVWCCEISFCSCLWVFASAPVVVNVLCGLFVEYSVMLHVLLFRVFV